MNNQKWSLCFISLASLFIASYSDEFLIQQVTENTGTKYNSSHSLGANFEVPAVTTVLREERPSSKIVTITSWSMIMGKGESYLSSTFEAAGYKWVLVVFLNRMTDGEGNYYVSLYVEIVDTESLPNGWEVLIDLKLFVHNPKLQKYLTVTDGTVKRFNKKRTSTGYPHVMHRSTFVNPSEGYIVGDTCGFGAEILLVKPAQQQEKVTFITNPPNNVFTWKILGFSNLDDTFHVSGEYLIGDRYWRLGYRPEEKVFMKEGIAIYLVAEDHRPNTVASDTWGAVNLRLKNQRSSNHKQIFSGAWYPRLPGHSKGSRIIIQLSDLLDKSKGFLVNDAIIFEAEMVVTSVINIVSA